MEQHSKIDFKSLLDRNKLKERIRLIFNINVVRNTAWVFFALVMILLSYSCSKLFWSFFPEYINKKVNTTTTTNVRVERNYLDEIFNSRIFPSSPEKLSEYNRRLSQNGRPTTSAGPKTAPSVAAAPAQQTRPNVKITGILASDKPDHSVAILVFNNEENVYSEGDQLTGSAIRVSRIYEDRIVLLSADRKETYTYYMELSENDRVKLLKENTARANPPVQTAARPAPALGPNLPAVQEKPAATASNAPAESGRVNNGAEPKGQSRDETRTASRPVSSNPLQVTSENSEAKVTVSVGTSIQDYVNISPVENEQGTGVKGYRLNPGRKPELFTRSGFLPNDLAIRVNGYDLTDPAQTRQLFAEFSTTKNFEITVERNGIPENIYINIGESPLPNTTNTGVR